MKRRFIVNALYFDARHQQAFKRYLLRLMAWLRDPDDEGAKMDAIVALQSLYELCLLDPSEQTRASCRLCLERLRDGHRAEWARLLRNAMFANAGHTIDLFAELKAMSPFADKKIGYAECSLGYFFAQSENEGPCPDAGSLVWPLRKKQSGLIERFCILYPASGEGEPAVVPLEQDRDP